MESAIPQPQQALILTRPEIARITRQSAWTVRRWLYRIEAEGCAGLEEALRSARPPVLTTAIELFLREAVGRSPRGYGCTRPGWTTALLAHLVRRQFKRSVTDECVRQHLAQVDGVSRRPTWTVKHRAQPNLPMLKKGWITRRLNAPPRGADLCVEDEAELSLFPTLTRMWMLRGQQRKIPAPGVRPPKRHEYGAVDWRTGDFIRMRAANRNSEGSCRLVEECMARSAARKRKVVMLVDDANLHRPEKSSLMRQLCERYGPQLKLVYIPKYSPECMPIELFWNDWRDNVTHNHDRTALAELTGDSDRYLRRRKRNRQAVLRTLGSPFAARQRCKILLCSFSRGLWPVGVSVRQPAAAAVPVFGGTGGQ